MTEPDGELIVRPLTGITDPRLLDYLDLYETAFPAEERIPVSSIVGSLIEHGGNDESGSVFLVARRKADGQFAGLVHLMMLPEAVLLLYIAASKEMRGRGYGGELFGEVVRRARELGQFVIFEVEEPDYCAPERKDDALRRIAFYRRHGCVMLQGISYTQRVPFYPDGVPMNIMAHPAGGELNAGRVFEVARTVLGEDVKLCDGQLALE